MPASAAFSCAFPATKEFAKTIKHVHFKGLLPYLRGNEIQEHIVARALAYRDCQILKRNPRLAANLPKDSPPASHSAVLSFEFEPVYTGGKREKKNTTSKKIDAMDQMKHVSFVQTNRGGQVTFHGPGQIVIYPILDLSAYRGLTSRCYVSTLEKSIIGVLSGDPFHLPAKTTENTGVWVDSKETYNEGTSIKKISSLGVNVRRSVTSHGCSINCKTDLSYVNDPQFVMCGLSEFKQTSISNELGKMDVSLETVSDLFVRQLAGRLGIEEIDRIEIERDNAMEDDVFRRLDDELTVSS
ncbi:DEKNAAC105371 [Brettanomyces naardenensis]|uniref:Octanoyltransferase n=1 Tax=Brettanomyces naardenensis TaxID=13370 RepID=A0A448YT58_BRENA|nr:DEKNAAC105371 [Brettanomyces naardenensis]